MSTYDVKIDFFGDEDRERANIFMRSFGCVTELRFGDHRLDAVARFSSVDFKRILDALAEAERQRIDPDAKTIECITFLRKKIDYADDDKNGLYLEIEAEMPIAASDSVRLEPLFEGKSISDLGKPSSTEDEI